MLLDLGPNNVVPIHIRVGLQTGIFKRETFNPYQYIWDFQEIIDSIDTHACESHGHSLAVFTGSMRTAEFILSTTGSDYVIANINNSTYRAEIVGTFGGETETGGRSESGSDAWRVQNAPPIQQSKYVQ